MSIRLILVIIMLSAAAVLSVFLIRPKYQDLRQIQAEFDQKKSELDSKTNYYSRFKEIWSRLEEYQDSLAKIDAAIPDSYSLPNLFYYFQKITGQTGLVLEGLTFGGAKGEEIKELDFTLKASGSYSSLKNFLFAMENSAIIFKVKSVSFSSSQEDGSFSFDFGISTYSY